ncbi:putative CRISPR associated hypothetical protein [Methanosarcina sp. WWM596]|nr:putative CRISPR associated hypothetical protein [Methanosarcina sp. WWM596]
MWGTPKQFQGPGSGDRFIPTRVGNSKISVSQVTQAAVHPHACGELLTSILLFFHPIGSSPRVWGTPMIGNVFYMLARFIPTRVGNSVYLLY